MLLVTMLIFGVVRLIPGDVIDLMVSEMSYAAGTVGAEEDLTIEWIRHELGMDVPIHHQYVRWLGIWPQEDGAFRGIFQGDFGYSLWTHESITKELLKRIPVSWELGGIAFLLGLLISLPIGIYSAVRQDTPGDYVGRSIAIILISVPAFWLATIVIVYPSIYLDWMPPVRYIPFNQDPMGNIGQFIIPSIILGTLRAGTTMRMTRTMMLEVLRQDYIRTAWAKGLNEKTVIFRHALKNALIPVITLEGTMIPIIIAGSVILETIFALPGMGLYLVEALYIRDYPIISAINVVVASAVLVINLMIDISYGWLDPRVTYK